LTRGLSKALVAHIDVGVSATVGDVSLAVFFKLLAPNALQTRAFHVSVRSGWFFKIMVGYTVIQFWEFKHALILFFDYHHSNVKFKHMFLATNVSTIIG
jgi:hypothetical protein